MGRAELTGDLLVLPADYFAGFCIKSLGGSGGLTEILMENAQCLLMNQIDITTRPGSGGGGLDRNRLSGRRCHCRSRDRRSGGNRRCGRRSRRWANCRGWSRLNRLDGGLRGGGLLPENFERALMERFLFRSVSGKR